MPFGWIEVRIISAVICEVISRSVSCLERRLISGEEVDNGGNPQRNVGCIPASESDFVPSARELVSMPVMTRSGDSRAGTTSMLLKVTGTYGVA